MNKQQLAIACLLIGTLAFSQTGNVGINTPTPNSTLEINGSFGTSIQEVTNPSAFALDGTQQTLIFRGTGGSITLPDPTTCKGREYTLVNFSSGNITANMTFDAGTGTRNFIASQSVDKIKSNGTIWVKADNAPGSGSSNAWALLGNSGTTAGTNFIGTTDNNDLVMKRAGINSGWLSDPDITGNTSFGVDSFPYNSGSGTNNTAIGTYALRSNKSSENVAVGYQALTLLSTGASGSGQNTAVGTNALGFNNGNLNTAVGYQAGKSIGSTTGISNTFVGGNAGVTIQGSSSNNTFIGYLSGSGDAISTISGNRNTAIGNKATLPNLTASDQLSISNIIFGTGLTGTPATPAGNIGIGTSAPGVPLDVRANAANVMDISGITSTVVRVRQSNGTIIAPTATTSGDLLGAVRFAGHNGTGYTGGLAGMQAQATQNFSASGTGTSLSFQTTASGTTGAVERVRIAHNGNVGINNTSPNNTLEVTSATAGTSGVRMTNLTSAVALSSNASGDIVPSTLNPANGLYWGLTGNSGTIPGTNFVGTTDDKDVVFKRGGTFAGWISNSVATASNTSFGNNALSANFGTTGFSNSAFGNNALSKISTQANNTAFGANALANAISNDNAAFGESALVANTTGFRNAAFGRQALAANTTGSYNTAIGGRAIMSGNAGDNNVAIGFGTLANASFTGSQNTIVGANNGNLITSGIQNVMIGTLNMNAGNGSYNTIAGYNAMVKAYGDQNTIIGHLSFGATSMGAIGATANTTLGALSLQNLNSGSGGSDNNNTAIGFNAGGNLLTGSYNIALGDNTAFVSQTGSRQLNIGNIIYGANLGIANPQIGIGGSPDGNTLAVNGSASKQGGGTWATYSDYRVKKDINSFKDGLSVIMQLKPVTFRYNEKSGYTDLNKQFVGFIAQDVEKVAPYMVTKVDDSKVSGLSDKRAFDESALTKILVNAVQEQQKEIELLKEEVKQLKEVMNSSKK